MKFFIHVLFLATSLVLASCQIQRFEGEPVDVFLVAGQSNGWGVGNASLAPVPATGTCFFLGPKDSRLFTPFSTYSSIHWTSILPAFAKEYFSQSGRKICMVQYAIGNTSLFAFNDVGFGNWSSSGNLRKIAADRVNLAMLLLNEKRFTPIFRGIIWMQGEAEAPYFDAGEISKSQDEEALVDLFNSFKQNIRVTNTFKFGVVRTGTEVGANDEGFSRVRESQNAFCADIPDTIMLYTNTYLFPTLGWMTDSLHYNQYGLNDIGQKSADVFYHYSP